MPGVEVVSVSAESFCGVFRSTMSPSAIRGATAGSTRALQPVEGSPSMASLGSPKPAAGYAYGLYVVAAFVSSVIGEGASASLLAPPDAAGFGAPAGLGATAGAVTCGPLIGPIDGLPVAAPGALGSAPAGVLTCSP